MSTAPTTTADHPTRVRGSLYDGVGHAAASETTDAILADLLAAYRSPGPGAVVGAAPAGGGKTFFVVSTIERLVAEGVRVFLAMPTNEQVLQVIERLLDRGVETTFLHRANGARDAATGLRQTSSLVDASVADVVVSTVSKLGFSIQSDKLPPDFDLGDRLLVLDEAYQVKSGEYLRVADPFRTHLLVGDPGQLEPFTSLGDVDHWRGRPEDPLATAVSTVLRFHGERGVEREDGSDGTVAVHRFPLTRRLDSSGADLARPFYGARHAFGAWVLPGVRSLDAGPDAPPEVSLAAAKGWSYALLPDRRVDLRDVEVAERIADAAVSLVGAVATREVAGREETEEFRLAPGDVIVGVTRNEQRQLVQKALRERDVSGFRVLTANKAQGLECAVSLVWHPLTGASETSAFSLDAGRLCVLLTRHKHACVVFGRVGDDRVLDDVPPPTPAYPGVGDPVLDGWYKHKGLMRTLLGAGRSVVVSDAPGH